MRTIRVSRKQVQKLVELGYLFFESKGDPICTVLGSTPRRDLTDAVAGILASLQSGRNARFDVGRYARPAEPLALRLGPPKPSAHPFLDDRTLELRLCTPNRSLVRERLNHGAESNSS